MKFTLLQFFKSRSIVILNFLAAISLATYFLLGEFDETLKRDEGLSVATVVRVTGSVRSKSAGSFIWRNLRPDDSLHAKETISIGSNGYATLRMSDGALIEIEANTFVVLEGSDKQNPSLLQGAFVLRQRDGKGDRRISRDEDSGEDVRELLVNLAEPPLFSVLFSSTATLKKIHFAWSDLRNTAKASVVQISRNRDFTLGTLIEVIPKEKTTEVEAELSPGIYFWRVLDQKGLPMSEMGQFTLVETQPLQPLSPSGKTFSWSDTVRFHWMSPQMEFAPADATHVTHEVEIARDASFKKILARQIVKAGQVSCAVQNIAEGTYFWRIKTKIDDAISTSKTENFQLEPATLLTLESQLPRDDAYVKAKSSVDFAWKSNADDVDYQLHVFTSDGKEVKNLKTQENSALQALPEGNYQWKVSATKGNFHGETKMRRFSILAADSLRLTAPRRGERMIQSDARPFQFAWENGKGASRFRVEVSTDRSFENLLAYKDYDTSPAPSGDLILSSSEQYYFWRVIAYSGERPVSMSPTGEFRFGANYALPAPTLLFPAPGATLDPVADKRAPSFSWKPVKGAESYEFVLFENGGGMDFTKAYVKTNLKTTKYEAKDLPEGRFAWLVKSIDRNNRSGEASETRHVMINYGTKLRAPAGKTDEVQ